jgi:threonine dehydrogenase-like Zn-dependent dehydrogenase
MRAVAAFPRERVVRMIEEPEPRKVEGTEVLLRVHEVGICGTDRELAAFEYGTPPPGSDHLVVGHEAVAEIVACGDAVTWARPSELVIPTVRRPCSETRCPACRVSRPDFCTTDGHRERGIVRADGYLTEYVVEEEQYLVPVPRSLEDVAVLVEPLSIAFKAGQQLSAMRDRLPFQIPNPRGLVLGAGPVGLLGAMGLVALGAETVVFSREPEDSARADLVRSFGARYVSSEQTPAARLSELGQVDVVFEAVGVSRVALDALSALKRNGVFVLTGVPRLRPPEPYDMDRVLRDLVLNNQLLVGTVNAGRSAYERAVTGLAQFMALFPESVRRLIRRAGMDDATALLSKASGTKDVIRIAA